MQQGQGNPQDMQLMSFFRMVDRDNTGQLSATELQQALVNGDWSAFSIETVQLMIDMFDRDQSGTLNFQEFCGIWNYINQWRNLFFQFDQDRSGFIGVNELGNALRSFGFQVNDQFVGRLLRKYVKHTNPNKNSGGAQAMQNPQVPFDTFIRACIEVKMANDIFRQNDTQNRGSVNLSYDQFMDVYALR